MNRQELQAHLQRMDLLGKFVFTAKDINLWFCNSNLKTIKASLNRHVQAQIIEHTCRGIYVNPHARSRDSYILEHIAKALRRGEYNYLSLESVLSAAGIISQIPLDTITVITTGRSQTYKTSYGTIEFIHTKKKIPELLSGIYSIPERPLRIATVETALRDLKRVGRNLDLIDLSE